MSASGSSAEILIRGLCFGHPADTSWVQKPQWPSGKDGYCFAGRRIVKQPSPPFSAAYRCSHSAPDAQCCHHDQAQMAFHRRRFDIRVKDHAHTDAISYDVKPLKDDFSKSKRCSTGPWPSVHGGCRDRRPHRRFKPQGRRSASVRGVSRTTTPCSLFPDQRLNAVVHKAVEHQPSADQRRRDPPFVDQRIRSSFGGQDSAYRSLSQPKIRWLLVSVRRLTLFLTARYATRDLCSWGRHAQARLTRPTGCADHELGFPHPPSARATR